MNEHCKKFNSLAASVKITNAIHIIILVQTYNCMYSCTLQFVQTFIKKPLNINKNDYKYYQQGGDTINSIKSIIK